MISIVCIRRSLLVNELMKWWCDWVLPHGLRPGVLRFWVTRGGKWTPTRRARSNCFEAER